jgi:Ca2+-binding RTX toxin-like protein
MATFNITVNFSFVNGTLANDTFNINAYYVTTFGLDGDDQFSVGTFLGGLSLDGGAGNDSFQSRQEQCGQSCFRRGRQ